MQQRGHGPAETDRRKADVTTAYTSPDAPTVAAILKRYNVALVVVGPLERKTYGADLLARFDAWADLLSPRLSKSGGHALRRERRLRARRHGDARARRGAAGRSFLRVDGAGASRSIPPGGSGSRAASRRMRQGRIWVADFGNDRIQSFSDALAPLLAFGRHGTAPGSFKDPCGIAVGPDGLVYVADTWNGARAGLRRGRDVAPRVRRGLLRSARDRGGRARPRLRRGHREQPDREVRTDRPEGSGVGPRGRSGPPRRAERPRARAGREPLGRGQRERPRGRASRRTGRS